MDRARSQLDDLTVVEARPTDRDGYDRSSFPHWASQGNGCDTREVVLKRDGKDVDQDEECRAISGTWLSGYDGKKLTEAADVDIDHVVPLANAWRSGADAWPLERRAAFANDLRSPQLLAVSASSNRSKGDQSPDEWQPPNNAYWCTYGRAWTAVKHGYDLTVTRNERNMLAKMLDTCDS